MKPSTPKTPATAHTPEAADDWEPISFSVRAYASKKANAGSLMGAVHETHTCGCRVVGNGSIPHPLTIKFCPVHKASDDILQALQEVVLAWANQPLNITHDDGNRLKTMRRATELCNRLYDLEKAGAK